MHFPNKDYETPLSLAIEMKEGTELVDLLHADACPMQGHS